MKTKRGKIQTIPYHSLFSHSHKLWSVLKCLYSLSLILQTIDNVFYVGKIIPFKRIDIVNSSWVRFPRTKKPTWVLMIQVDCFNHWCSRDMRWGQLSPKLWQEGGYVACPNSSPVLLIGDCLQVRWPLHCPHTHSLYVLWALFLQPVIPGCELLHCCKVFPSAKPATHQSILGYSTPFSLNSFSAFMALVNNIVSPFPQKFNILTPMSKYFFFWVPMTALGPEENSLTSSKHVS